ncbi:MAG: NHL repeat protein, partial [Candidatus Frackibacter sp. T328-2]
KFINEFGYITDKKDIKRLKRPTGLAIDEKRKRVYVADTRGHNIQVYNLKGKLLKVIGKQRGNIHGTFNYPIAVAVDQKGKIYVGDTLNYRVQILNSKGEFVRQIDGGPGQTLGSLPRAKGIAIDNKGRTYITDGYLQVVQIFNQKGKLTSFFGRPGVSDKQFRLPAEIEIDDQGRIYIVDTMNRRVQVLKLQPPKKEDKSNKNKDVKQKKSDNKSDNN